MPGQAAGPIATVLRPDGRPMAGARVYRTRLNEGLSISDGVVTSGRGSGRELRTGPDGTFPIPAIDEPFVVLILGDEAYAYASKAALAISPRIQSQPYARVEGRFLVGTLAMPDQPMEIGGMLQDDSTMYCTMSFHATAKTDRDGRFVLERVIPLPHLRARVAPGPRRPRGPGRSRRGRWASRCTSRPERRRG